MKEPKKQQNIKKLRNKDDCQMITVSVKVAAYLRRLNGCSGGKTELDLFPGSRVKDVLKDLGALPGEIGLIILNGRAADLQSLLNDGDNLELYQIFGGG